MLKTIKPIHVISLPIPPTTERPGGMQMNSERLTIRKN